MYKNQGPRRDKSDKWYVSREEYPDDTYPPWCEGFAYITKPTLTRKLYQASLRVKYYWIDDVYVTGILMQKIGAKHRQFRNPFGYGMMGTKNAHTDGRNLDVIFLLDKYGKNKHVEIWKAVWNQTLAKYIPSRSYKKRKPYGEVHKNEN